MRSFSSQPDDGGLHVTARTALARTTLGIRGRPSPTRLAVGPKFRGGFGVLFSALALGLLLALLAGKTRQASVEIWVAVVAGWLAWELASRVIKLAPLLPERLPGVWTRRRTKPGAPARLRPLIAAEGLLRSAENNERTMALRLRPRLAALSDHMLQTQHGIDAEARPDRAAAVLGELAWLVDPEAEPRVASLTDVEQLFDVLMVDESRTSSDPNPSKAGVIDAG